jgi:hypothetical protein
MTVRIPTRTCALLLATLMSLAACRKNQDPPVQSAPGTLADIDKLTDAEKKYGMGARRDPNITLQPDVVLMEAGPTAIRAQGENGFTWTIDPDAEGADEIKPGKILLLTSRAAGKVLHAQRTERGLEVILGPAEITEFIKDGEFQMDQPVNFEKMLEYQRPEIFNPEVAVPPIIASSGQFTTMLASFARPRQTLGDQAFRMFNLYGSDGFGLEIASREGHALYMGQARFYMSAPRVVLDLKIANGGISKALVELKGVAGFGLAFESGLPSPSTTNISAQKFAPVDYAIPVIPLFGVPFTVTIRQQLRLQTAFTGTGTLKARVRYELQGSLRAGYENGQWGLIGPTGVKPIMNIDTMLVGTQGVSLGVAGIALTHQTSVMVGIGVAGFSTGPYGYLNTSVTVTRGSDAGILTGPMACRQGTIAMGVGAGVGYSMPAVVSDAINAILGALNINRKVEPFAGIQTPAKIIVNIGRKFPGIEACG